MKKILLLLVFLTIPLVLASSINDTDLNSIGLNSTILIRYPVNFSLIELASGSIFFLRVNSSNPAELIKGNDSITFNFTQPNKNYSGLQLPYFAFSNNVVKTIVSGITKPLNGSIVMQTDSCALQRIRYVPASGTGIIFNATDINCVNNIARLNYTNLPSGTSNFYLSNFIITNCTEGNISMHFEIFDEDTPTGRLTADSEIEVLYWRTPQDIVNITVAFPQLNNFSICLDPVNTSVDVDIYVRYNTTGGFLHRYFLANRTLNIEQQNISMYNFDTTTGISDLKITLRQASNFQPFTGIIGKLQRRYLSEDIWRTVQMDRAGDFGLLFYNIREETTDYRFIFHDSQNKVLRTTEQLKFVCTSSICELTFLLSNVSAIPATIGTTITSTYDPSAKTLTTVWSNNLGETSSVRTTLKKHTPSSIITICDFNQVGASGTNVCDASVYTGQTQYVVTVNGDVRVSDWIQLNTTQIGNFLDDSEGALWSVGMISVTAMFGIFSPVGGMIALVISLIAITLLGIFPPITLPFVIVAAVVAIAIGFKVRN